ncbi:MAG: SGNH/GDSL hydrolase family protein [Sedimentisphaerales bacterium]|nr:SGNH/GDSL hydrolase family protein [Sedimentisphaerales bacterium]
MKSTHFGVSLAANGVMVILLLAVANHYNWPTYCLDRVRALPRLRAASDPPSHLQAFDRTLRQKQSLTVVAFGDSVTQGYTGVHTREPSVVYHHQLKRLLEERYPTHIFNILNAGLDGNTAETACKRLDSVIRHDPDLVVIQFGLNDIAANGLYGLRAFERAVTRIIDRLRRETRADLVLMTPNFIATGDNPRLPPCLKKSGEWKGLIEMQNGGVPAQYAQLIRRIGAEKNVAVADVYAAWEQLSEQTDTNTWLANGINHPDARGHRLAAETIMALIDPGFTVDMDRCASVGQTEKEDSLALVP